MMTKKNYIGIAKVLKKTIEKSDNYREAVKFIYVELEK